MTIFSAFRLKGEYYFVWSETGGSWTATVYFFRDGQRYEISATDEDRHKAMGRAVARLRASVSDED